MLRTLRQCGAEVLPSNSRVRRRRTSSPPQGPPASRPVGGLRTLRILRENVSASSGRAPPAVGIAARDFRFEARIRMNEVFVGAKCNHAYRQCYSRVRSPQEASVQCGQSSALRSSAAGSFQAVTPLPPQAPSEESRPSTPRYGSAVFIPACYSSTPPPGRIPPEVFRAGRGQAFRLLAQTVSVCSASKPQPKLPQTAPGAWCKALRPRAFYLRSSNGPSRPRPRRPSAHAHRRSLPLLQGACSLPSAALQSPPPLSLPDRLRGHAPLRSAPYGTGRLTAATHKPTHIPGSCETASTIGPPRDLRPSVSATSAGITRPDGGKRV